MKAIMQKSFVVLAVVMAGSTVWASKARLNSLSAGEYLNANPQNGPAHIVDIQTTFNNPAHNLLLGEYVTFEFGPTTTTNVLLGAEGGFARKLDNDAMLAFYLGRKSKFTTNSRAALGFVGQENPLEVQYAKKGDGMDWGLGFNYSNSDYKSTEQKQSAMGLRFGMIRGDLDAFAVIGLGSSAAGNSAGGPLGMAADVDSKYTGTAGFKLGARYAMDNNHAYIEHYTDGAKVESAGNPGHDGMKMTTQNTRIGYLSAVNIDGAEVFYGVEYQMDAVERKDAPLAGLNTKDEVTSLPIYAGIEVNAASWLALRASIRQNFILGGEKVGDKTDSVANNTAVAAGAGLNLGKWTMDTVLTAQTNGDVAPGSANFMANSSLTYKF